MQAELLTHPIIALADGVRVLLEGLSVLTVLAGRLFSPAHELEASHHDPG